MLGHAVDLSNYSGVPTEAQAAGMRAAGNDLAICGTQDARITKLQAAALGRAGLACAAYVFLWFDESPADQVARARAAAGGFAQRLWLDCEDDEDIRAAAGRPGRGASDLSEAATIAFIHAAIAACGDMPIGIYTRRGWWERQTGNSTAFAAAPLWDATNDHLPDLGFPIPYGGWTAPAMEQYAFDRLVAGVNCDLNVYERTAPPPPPAPLGPNIDVSRFRFGRWEPDTQSWYYTGIEVLRHWGGALGPNMSLVWEGYDAATQRDRFGVRVLKSW